MSATASVAQPNPPYSTSSPKLRVLVVDDEPIARKVLRQELDCFEGIEIVGEAENGETALSLIYSLKPDLVFLDIQMPVMGGFELLTHLSGGNTPAIIMLTAFDQHAIRAFEAGAVDYLLKPVSPPRLRQSLERAARLRTDPRAFAENIAQLQQISAANASPDQRLRKIVGKTGEEYFLLNPEEVLAFQANGDLVWIVTAKKRYLATQNLKTLESRLSADSFRRIHRNALVNVNQIRKMSMLSSQRWLITLSNGQEFIVSKRQAHSVRDVLHW
jgi:two-component system LytT family response regulator